MQTLEEDIMTITPEPSPEPEPVSPEPEPVPAPAESGPVPEPGVTVVSVDELVDRLIQSADTGEEAPVLEEPAEEPVIEEPPAETDPPPMEILGMDKLLAHAETIQQTLDHPLLTTSFHDYTVTEGLLLLILLAAFAAVCVKILKGGFQWLRW